MVHFPYNILYVSMRRIMGLHLICAHKADGPA